LLVRAEEANCFASVETRTAETCLSPLPREKTVEPCPAALMSVSEFVTVRTSLSARAIQMTKKRAPNRVFFSFDSWVYEIKKLATFEHWGILDLNEP
jgi:hypothetical protein